MNYFYYDALLRRYAMQDSNGLNYFTWDTNGMNLLCERDVSGNVTAYYTHGFAAVDGIGSTVAVKQNRFGAAYFQYPGYDHKGDLTVVTDENGNEVARYNYTANGVTLTNQVTGGISETRLGYQTNWIRLQDAPFDMYVSPTRLEVPEYAIFLGRDPKRGLAGDIKYADGDPVNNVDPRGTQHYPPQDPKYKPSDKEKHECLQIATRQRPLELRRAMLEHLYDNSNQHPLLKYWQEHCRCVYPNYAKWAEIMTAWEKKKPDVLQYDYTPRRKQYLLWSAIEGYTNEKRWGLFKKVRPELQREILRRADMLFYLNKLAEWEAIIVAVAITGGALGATTPGTALKSWVAKEA